MVNDLGVDPDEWFDYPNPLDSMPVATDKGSPSWIDTAPSEYEPPDDEEFPAEFMEVATSVKNPKPQPKKVEKTIHQKMYDMAIEKHNPWSGGSENFHMGGSEKINGTE